MFIWNEDALKTGLFEHPAGAHPLLFIHKTLFQALKTYSPGIFHGAMTEGVARNRAASNASRMLTTGKIIVSVIAK